MIRAVRIVIGMALGLVVAIAPAWGIFHLVRQGSCGDVGQSACPDQTGLWVVAIVLSATIAGPLAVLIAGTDRRGVPWLLVPVIGVFTVGQFAGSGVSLAGSSADDDTRWVGIVLLGIGALVAFGLVRAILAALLGGSGQTAGAGAVTPDAMRAAASAAARAAATRPARPPATPKPSTPPREQQLGQLTAQLRAVMQDRTAATASVAQRLRRLTDLLESGLISREEHDARRREILDEV